MSQESRVKQNDRLDLSSRYSTKNNTTSNRVHTYPFDVIYLSFFPFKKVISQFRNPEAFFYTSFSFTEMSGGNKEESCTRLEMKQQSKYGRLNHHSEEEKGVALHPHADTQDNSERHA